MKDPVFDPAKLNSGKTEWITPRPTLDEIGIFHQTDKASQFTRTYAKPHDYLRHMEPFFEPIRDGPIKLLEIGVGGGESIRTWLEFFTHPNSRIFGVDIVQGTNEWNTPGSGVHPRYTFTHGDQGDAAAWDWFNGPHQLIPWDIIIDDGSHYAKDIITTFNALWPHIAPSGIYVIEDLNTAYGGAPFTSLGHLTQMDFIKDMLDLINQQQREIERLHFSRELCIIQKSHV